MTKIEKYIQDNRIERSFFKTEKAAVLNSLINGVGHFENNIYVLGELKLKFEYVE